MALLFGTAGSDRVEVADSSSLRNLTAATYLCWAYVTSTANSRFCQKGTAVAVNYRSFGVTSAELTAQVYRPTLTTNATATLTNFAAWGTSKWCFFAGVHDSGGVNGDQKLYIGDLTTLAAEPSSYSVQIVGSGAVGDNTGAIQYIAVTGAATLSLPGRIAVMQIYNRVLTVAEIRSLQFEPRALNGCVGYWILGNAATATQADYSGNANAGTVTGATVADHVPLPAAFGTDQWVEIARASAPAATDGRAGARGLDVGNSGRSSATIGHTGARAQCAGVKAILATETGRAGAEAQTSGITSASGVGTFTAHAGVRGLDAGTAVRTAGVVGRAGISGQCAGAKVILAADLARAGTRGLITATALQTATGAVVGRAGLRTTCAGRKASAPGAVGAAGTRGLIAGSTAHVSGLHGSVGLQAASNSIRGITGFAVGRAGVEGQNVQLITGHGEVEWAFRLARSRWRLGSPVQ